MVLFSILIGTVWYSGVLANKISLQERRDLGVWVEAQKTILNSSDTSNLNLATLISSGNIEIPVIETDENDKITNNYLNLDSNAFKKDPKYLQTKLESFKEYAQPIVLVIGNAPYIANKYYYGPSLLLQQVRYYPLVQLVVVFFFIVLAMLAQRADYKSSQNQVWAGLAKETAHQLGTPVSSLQGWAEMIKDLPGGDEISFEMSKDIDRLLLITDRFSKIGSSPLLETSDISQLVSNMIGYIKKRAGGKVKFTIDFDPDSPVFAKISPPLFDWVVENLLKNALDAMEGNGLIHISLKESGSNINIDVADSGKGIPKSLLNKVFNPGFTTKKRGWGLGLTLSKRIVEQYHKGQLTILHSELGKGTTFRIQLQKQI